MRLAPLPDVEILLTRQARTALPFGRLLLLYLDPFSLFKDATRGPSHEREHARSYNRDKRWILLAYLRRWIIIAAASFAAMAPAEAMAAEATFFAVPAAAFAVGCCIAVTVATCIGVAYFLLAAGARR